MIVDKSLQCLKGIDTRKSPLENFSSNLSISLKYEIIDLLYRRVDWINKLIINCLIIIFKRKFKKKIINNQYINQSIPMWFVYIFKIFCRQICLRKCPNRISNIYSFDLYCFIGHCLSSFFSCPWNPMMIMIAMMIMMMTMVPGTCHSWSISKKVSVISCYGHCIAYRSFCSISFVHLLQTCIPILSFIFFKENFFCMYMPLN
jgi:hypothetical protein